MSNPTSHSLGHVVRAWLVHAFTMTGIAWASLAAIALVRGDVLAMWGWLGVALVVDGLDGTFARRAEVKKYVPWFDGSVLDLIVDYLTWTFIPALFMYLHVPFGPGPMPLIMMITICATSMFCYCNTGMKSSDNYFVGFPAAWNIVAVYFWILQTGPVFNVVASIVLAALTLAPIVFLHPFRVRHLMPVNLVAVGAWFAATVALVVMHPVKPLWILAVWWLGMGWCAGISVWRTLRGRQARSSRPVDA
ncbi:CDP-alcohol phosphatidyltransferase family protein [Mariniluteicoccus flavus]